MEALDKIHNHRYSQDLHLEVTVDMKQASWNGEGYPPLPN